MARGNSINFTGPLQYPIADSATDLFKKEDVQVATKALDLHDHSPGKGLPLPAGSISNSTITSAMIVDGTIATADLADGSVTTAKHADASVTNAKLASDTARANLLVNGGMEIWQRWTGAAVTANGAFAADRWQLSGAGLNVQVDNANADNSPTCMAVTCTFSASPTQIQQKLEIPGSGLRGRTFTFSVRVRTSTANAVRLGVYDGSFHYATGYHSGSGVYETLTFTYALGSAATYCIPLIDFVASCTAYLDNAMLVMGSVAADYAPLHPADDLARCLRYYEVIGPNSAVTVTVQGYEAAGGQTFRQSFRHVRKAVNPTVTKVGTWSVVNCAQPTVVAGDVDGFMLSIAGTGPGTALAYNGAAGTFITAEANP